jgi:hypothetical protein
LWRGSQVGRRGRGARRDGRGQHRLDHVDMSEHNCQYQKRPLHCAKRALVDNRRTPGALGQWPRLKPSAWRRSPSSAARPRRRAVTTAGRRAAPRACRPLPALFCAQSPSFLVVLAASADFALQRELDPGTENRCLGIVFQYQGGDFFFRKPLLRIFFVGALSCSPALGGKTGEYTPH